MKWRMKEMSEVSDVQSGNSISATDKTDKYFFGQEGTPYVSTKDIGFFGEISSNVEVVVPEPQLSKFRIAASGSSLICSEGGSAGKKVGFVKRRTCYGNKLFQVRPHSNVHPEFLFYFLKSNVFNTQFEEKKTGLIGGVSKKKFEKILIPMPDFEIQVKTINFLAKLLKRYDRIVKAEQDSFNLKKELIENRLEDLFCGSSRPTQNILLTDMLLEQPRNGWSPPAKFHSVEGTPVLTLSSVTNFIFNSKAVKFSSAPVDDSKNYWVSNGDFLMTRSNTPELVGHVAIAKGIEEPTIYPDLIMRMKVNPKIVFSEYLYLYLQTKFMRLEIKSRAKGANPTMKKLNKNSVCTLMIRTPSIPDQREILKVATKLTDALRGLKLRHNKKLTALSELRQSLLEKAFTDKLLKTSRMASLSRNVFRPFNDNYTNHAGVIAYADSYFHTNAPDTFHGRTIFEKVAQAAETIAGIELGRQAVQGMRGPTDNKQREAVEAMASEEGYFSFESTGGKGMKLKRGRNFNELKLSVEKEFQAQIPALDKFLRLIAPMPTRDVEVLSTVHTAWNNYLIEKQEPTDEQIVYAAREGWHEEKTKIPRHKFFTAIETLRQRDLVPTGQGKYVGKIAGQSFDF